MKFSETKGKYSIERIVDYITTNEEKVLVVCPEYSAATFMMYVIEKVTGLRILDETNISKRKQLLKDNESLIKMYLYDKHGNDKIVFLSDTYEDIENLSRNIIKAIVEKGVETVILNEYRRSTEGKQRHCMGEYSNLIKGLYGTNFIKTGDGFSKSNKLTA